MSTSEPLATPAATLTYPEAARYLGMSERSLQRLVAAGTVRHVRPTATRVRFRTADLDAYLDTVARGGTRRRGAR